MLSNVLKRTLWFEEITEPFLKIKLCVLDLLLKINVLGNRRDSELRPIDRAVEGEAIVKQTNTLSVLVFSGDFVDDEKLLGRFFSSFL